MLGREEPREVVAVLVDELVDAEEELGALREREVAPRRVRVRGGGDRAVDLVDGGERDLAGLLARRGVVDRSRPPGSPRTLSPPIQWPIVFSSVVTAAFISASWRRLLVVVAYRGG